MAKGGKTTTLCWTKNGGVLSDYVKIHPFSYGGEDRFYHSGEKLTSAVLGEIFRGNADLL